MLGLINGHLLLLIDGTLGLLFHKSAFYTVDLESGRREEIAKLPVSGMKAMLWHYRFTTRLLRLEPKCAGRLDDHRFVVCLMNKLWLLDLKKHSVEVLISMRQGYGLLNFCEQDGDVYWGDYGANPNYDEINIYRLNQNLDVSIVYTFPTNSIRHVHNIIKADDVFFVLTGDNEPMAGIYKANADWSEVKPWKNGEQKYRAVVGFPYMGGLLYATDSVESENHLRHIKADGTERIMTAINGSCIYGGETKDYYFFSTTVEPHEGGGLRKMLSYELGGGVKSRDVHLLAVRKTDLDVRLLMKLRKDLWPMKLFQYGTMIFPKGQENLEKGVWSYIMACKKNDGKTLLFKCNE